MRVIHSELHLNVHEGIFPAPCFLFVFTFLFQMLGTKYKHELLVDHPFADPAGSCGNFLSVVVCLPLRSAFYQEVAGKPAAIYGML